ncbi:MAG: septum formation inhibitor Maf [Verrucomicrobiota bacterium]
MRSYPLLVGLGLFALLAGPLTAADEKLEKRYRDYWFQAAEVNRYELTEQVYGQPRPGNAVLIYVTEPFDEKAGVKYEGRGPKTDVITVLKLNAMRTFLTGLYPYSLMTSVFTPYEPGYDVQPAKVTASMQDWCGQSFYQLDHKDGGLIMQWRSYFQAKGDGQEKMTDFPVEDNIWNQIRLAPHGLPCGECLMVPGFTYQRMGHFRPGPAKAVCELERSDQTHTYTITYPELGRVLAITFEAAFPHKITGWRERRSEDGGWIEAKLTHTKIMPYWQQNRPGDIKLRRELGLPLSEG